MMQLCMANGGITLDEAMLAATYNPALSLGLEGQAGTLQVSFTTCTDHSITYTSSSCHNYI